MEPEAVFAELLTGLLLLFLWLTFEKQESRTTSGCYVVERAGSVKSGSVGSPLYVLRLDLSNSRAYSLLGVFLFISKEAIPRRIHTSLEGATPLSVELRDCCKARTRRLNHVGLKVTPSDRRESEQPNGQKVLAGKRISCSVNKVWGLEGLESVNAKCPKGSHNSSPEVDDSNTNPAKRRAEMKQVKRSRSQISRSGKGEIKNSSADELMRKRKARGQLLLRELEAKQKEFLEQTFLDVKTREAAERYHMAECEAMRKEIDGLNNGMPLWLALKRKDKQKELTQCFVFELPEDMDMYSWVGVFNHFYPGFPVNEVETTLYQDEKNKKRIRCFLADSTKNEEFALYYNRSESKQMGEMQIDRLGSYGRYGAYAENKFQLPAEFWRAVISKKGLVAPTKVHLWEDNRKVSVEWNAEQHVEAFCKTAILYTGILEGLTIKEESINRICRIQRYDGIEPTHNQTNGLCALQTEREEYIQQRVCSEVPGEKKAKRGRPEERLCGSGNPNQRDLSKKERTLRLLRLRVCGFQNYRRRRKGVGETVRDEYTLENCLDSRKCALLLDRAHRRSGDRGSNSRRGDEHKNQRSPYGNDQRGEGRMRIRKEKKERGTPNELGHD